MLNLNTASGVGAYGELLASYHFVASKRVKFRPYDIRWKGKRIEVKTSSCRAEVLSKGLSRFWSFTFSKDQLKKATDFLLVLLNRQGYVFGMLLIPRRDYRKRTLKISASNLDNYLKYLVA